jgi:hypothetical protein
VQRRATLLQHAMTPRSSAPTRRRRAAAQVRRPRDGVPPRNANPVAAPRRAMVRIEPSTRRAPRFETSLSNAHWDITRERALAAVRLGRLARAIYTGAMSSEIPEPRATKRRIVCGWLVTALGFIGILWGVFHLTIPTIGGPIYQFKDRRTYTEVKTAMHEVYPGAVLRALGGLALVWLGGRIRAGTRRDGEQR